MLPVCLTKLLIFAEAYSALNMFNEKVLLIQDIAKCGDNFGSIEALETEIQASKLDHFVWRNVQCVLYSVQYCNYQPCDKSSDTLSSHFIEKTS